MRRGVFFEGKVLEGHEMIIRPGAIDIDGQGRYPVVVNFNYQDRPIAWATQPQVDDDTGEVSFEIEWIDPTSTQHFEDEELYGFSMYIQDVKVNKAPDDYNYPTIEDAVLRAISIIDHKIGWREP